MDKYCDYPTHLKSRPRLYEAGWACTKNVVCIPMTKLCDGHIDCNDYRKSDEKKQIELPDKNMLPPRNRICVQNI